MKIVLYRGFKADLASFDHLVGQYEGNIAELLDNSEYQVCYLDAFVLKTDNDSTRQQFGADG
jgi:hypothetical protein